MRLIVAGSRGFSSFEQLTERLDFFLSAVDEPIEFVSGGARGADRLGERYAALRGYPVVQFIPDWHRLGRRAGIVRNEAMAGYATHLVAFWDGVSPGTQHMIDFARRRSLGVRVVSF